MNIGFIGGGNMASAIIGGILSTGIVKPEKILVASPHDRVSESLGVGYTPDNRKAAAASDVLFLAVKPQVCGTVIEEIRDSVREDQLIISIAAGKSLGWLRESFGRNLRIVRAMPNTPALVGEGMTAASPNEFVADEDLDTAISLLGSFGRVEVVPERLMDAVTAVSGSSPACVFLFIEAMADAAVAEGMPRAKAYTFAAQAVLGSAKMVLDTGKHPGELKDMVCSPAGTTIEEVRVLEEKGFRGAVMDSLIACAEKSRNL